MDVPKSRWDWTILRARRHWHWLRSQGLGRLIEEDDLNPVRHASLAATKWWWRRTQPPGIRSVAIFVVGVQRSGTNMLVRGLEESPRVEVYNENDRHAFDRFRLRPDSVIRRLIADSRHPYVLFKPLCDSHRTNALLDEVAAPDGRAIWAYRSVEGRTRSALAKFGPNNLDVLRAIAAGRGRDLWQAQGLSLENRALVESFDYERMTRESAAALFWYVRNSLYFDLELDRREDVMPVSYDTMISDPEAVMRPLCNFLGFPFAPRLVQHVGSREPRDPKPLEIDDELARRCEELGARLNAASARARERHAQHGPRWAACPSGSVSR